MRQECAKMRRNRGLQIHTEEKLVWKILNEGNNVAKTLYYGFLMLHYWVKINTFWAFSGRFQRPNFLFLDLVYVIMHESKPE